MIESVMASARNMWMKNKIPIPEKLIICEDLTGCM